VVRLLLVGGKLDPPGDLQMGVPIGTEITITVQAFCTKTEVLRLEVPEHLKLVDGLREESLTTLPDPVNRTWRFLAEAAGKGTLRIWLETQLIALQMPVTNTPA
jgi:hypothetical protein